MANQQTCEDGQAEDRHTTYLSANLVIRMAIEATMIVLVKMSSMLMKVLPMSDTHTHTHTHSHTFAYNAAFN